MSPRRDVSEERRGQIIEAAVKVFSQLGFHEARMDDIAAQAELSKGALYWYFKSKDDILTAILDQFFNQEVGGLAAFLEEDTPVTERLLRYNQLALADTLQFTSLVSITFEFYALAGRQEGVREKLKTYFERYRGLVRDLIQQGIDSGEFRPVDANVIAVAIMAFYEGLVLLMAVNPEQVDWKVTSENTLGMLLDGIRSQ
jgi:AcrR family transcriptional regulator